MTKYGQPAISRETRRLLITIVLSVASLWLLARVRFQDRPVKVDPIPAVLAQLRPQSTYDDLAQSLANLRPTVAASMAMASTGMPALRVTAATGIVVTGSTLALVDLPTAQVPSLNVWTPRTVDYPRYLVAADLTRDGNLSLRPVFIGSMTQIDSSIWNGLLWRLPPIVDLVPGTFVFTTDGLVAGVAVEDAGVPALLPAPAVIEMAGRLREDTSHLPASLGMTVAPTKLGLVVAWVDVKGPAAGHVAVTDIIESVDRRPVPTIEHWSAFAQRIASGDVVTLRVRTPDEVREVQIVAAPAVQKPEDSILGLRLRTARQRGAEVLGVEPGSSADRAGILQGDLITVIGREATPTSVQVRDAFEGLPDGGNALVAITRGKDHHVMVLEK
jgi:hypothetical protein